MADNNVIQFVVLFTAQKQKKFKTWQDGTMKYYDKNRKLVLIDEKGYNIDRMFCKGTAPAIGDELEFDRHLVTVESINEGGTINNTPAPQPATSIPSPPIPRTATSVFPCPAASNFTTNTHEGPQVRSSVTNKPYVPPFRSTSKSATPSSSTTNSNSVPRKRVIQPDSDEEESDSDMVLLRPQTATTSNQSAAKTPVSGSNDTALPVVDGEKSNVLPVKKPRFGLSKGPSTSLHSNIPALSRPLNQQRPVSAVNTDKQYANRSSEETINTSSPSIPFYSTNSTITTEKSSFTAASKIPTEQQPSTLSAGTTPRSTSSSFKSPLADGNYTPMTLQFPNSKKAFGIIKSKKYPRRTKIVPTKFSTISAYTEAFKKLIIEHLEILLLNYGLYFYTMYEKFGKNKRGQDLERAIRSKGLGLYVQCEIKSTYQSFTSSSPSPSSSNETLKRLRLMIKAMSREHSSKYSKNDIWVLSKVPTFESSQTFLARSTFFGPFSDGSLELECISPRDTRIATQALKEDVDIYALRTIAANTEFMMLDALTDDLLLSKLPLLPYLMTDYMMKKGDGNSKRGGKKVASLIQYPKLHTIQLTREDGIDVEAKLVETISMYKLNLDQERVLRQVAKAVIVAPGWNEDSDIPFVLVHGVYGSGKSYLAAVIIIFIQEIIDQANTGREPEDAIHFKMLVSSMTNVAVDRILQTLMKLGFDLFLRIGSMKKIAKNLLPYTAKARLSSNEELKELEQMLDDPLNSEEDVENISRAIQNFRKTERQNQLQSVNVVGTTFMASSFEVFNDVQFPFILIDESSQLLEPLTLVPLARFSCHKMVMIGDPLQLPPTLATNAEEGKVGKGLDKTMFDRMIEMGHESIMLRTQYRCHPLISGISNKLFYERRLLNGVTDQDRKPLIKGLPTVLFIDIDGGKEQKCIRNNSYSNDVEISAVLKLLNKFTDCQIPQEEIGVISLYKEQVDRLNQHLNTEQTSNKGIQISTVDAFQGGEKEIIILSTVRTAESQFMDNHPRINVALTRAKRHLIILGSRSLFSLNELWSRILWDCGENCLQSGHLDSFLIKLEPSSTV